MGEKCQLHIRHMLISRIMKKNEIMTFKGERMEPRTITVNKTSQSQKDKPVCSHMWNFSLACTVRPSGNRAGDTNAVDELLWVEKWDPAWVGVGKGLAGKTKDNGARVESSVQALALHSNLEKRLNISLRMHA